MNELAERIRSALVREATGAPSVDGMRDRFWSTLPPVGAARAASRSWRLPALAAAASVAIIVFASVALSGTVDDDDVDDLAISSPRQHTASTDDSPPVVYSERKVLAAGKRVFAAGRAGDVPPPNVAFADANLRRLVLEMRPADLKKYDVQELEARFAEIAGMPVKVVEGADQPPQPAVP